MMAEKKPKFAEMNLTEEDLRNKMKMLNDLKFSEQALTLRLESDKRMLESGLPLRNLKNKIEQTEEQLLVDKAMLKMDYPTINLRNNIAQEEQELERTRKNIKVIEKQIKSGKEKYLK